VRPENEVDAVLLDDLRRHESYRRFPYKDPVKGEKAMTVGFGHNLTANGIPLDVAETLLARYAVAAQDEVRELFPLASHPWLTAEHYRVMANMMYQLGAGRFRTFKKFITAVHFGDLEKARLELIDSAWFRQSKTRSRELVTRWENASA
jgi:GH24 family phage-related lysozyme (muramidase)